MYRPAAIVLGLIFVSVGCGSDSSPDANELSAGGPVIESSIGPESSAAVKALEAAGVVVKVDASGVPVDIDLRKAAIDSPLLDHVVSLSSLRTLNAADTTFNDGSLEQIKPLASQLSSLDLRGCPISDKSGPILATMTSLRALRLSGKNGKTSIGDDGLALLAGCKQLKVLAVDDLWVSGTTLEKLAGLTELEELYLARTTVDDAAMKLVAGYPKLRKLRLAGTQVGDDGLTALAAISTLEELDLSEISVISNAGLSHLAKLTSLRKLNLWRVQVTDPGILQLAPLVKLEWLNLDNTQMSDAGISVLKDMPSLTFLHLGSTQITAAAVPGLVHLTSLKDLKITRTALGSNDAAVAELKKALPKTAIQTEYVEGQ